jgi:hypothetical protein
LRLEPDSLVGMGGGIGVLGDDEAGRCRAELVLRLAQGGERDGGTGSEVDVVIADDGYVVGYP